MTVPSCPSCGAKFSHDKELGRCKHCLLPDAVLREGDEAVQVWKKQTELNNRMFGRVRARAAHAEAGKPKSLRKRNKHGRQGVKRARSSAS